MRLMKMFPNQRQKSLIFGNRILIDEKPDCGTNSKSY